MNKLTRLTALLLAMLMMFSTFATAETAYQVGGMTVENWQGIVDSAADKLFTIDEGGSGKVVNPPATVTPAPGAFYPYTDGVSVDLGAAAVEEPLRITASGVAVLKNADAGQWQMQYGNTWINITGATGGELWATSAMMNGMSSANFRKALGERNSETGEYASYTNVATVEIVAEVASSAFFMMNIRSCSWKPPTAQLIRLQQHSRPHPSSADNALTANSPSRHSRSTRSTTWLSP